jgi:hypothetical protein
MPCHDVSEILRLKLDGGDQLLEYQLSKQTCGKAVGVDDLLMGELAGFSSVDILSLEPDDFVAQEPLVEVAFLRLKHLFALQAGIRVLIGQEAGGRLSPITVVQIEYENETMILEADISVDMITNQIKSCGACGGCGK